MSDDQLSTYGLIGGMNFFRGATIAEFCIHRIKMGYIRYSGSADNGSVGIAWKEQFGDERKIIFCQRAWNVTYEDQTVIFTRKAADKWGEDIPPPNANRYIITFPSAPSPSKTNIVW